MLGNVAFATLLVCRIILGAGEGPAFAVAVHALFKWFSNEKRYAADRHPLAALSFRGDPGRPGAELN
jgi:hypothetical protein